MSAVQRYCNKAVYISDGFAAENTDVQHVTNLYSADNLKVTQHAEHDALADRVWLTTDSETLLTKTMISYLSGYILKQTQSKPKQKKDFIYHIFFMMLLEEGQLMNLQHKKLKLARVFLQKFRWKIFIIQNFS